MAIHSNDGWISIGNGLRDHPTSIKNWFALAFQARIEIYFMCSACVIQIICLNMYKMR